VVAVDGGVDGVEALFWWAGGGAGCERQVAAEVGGHVDLRAGHGGSEGLGVAGLAVVGSVQVGVVLEVCGWRVREDGGRV
jgi:hypothetical protein